MENLTMEQVLAMLEEERKKNARLEEIIVGDRGILFRQRQLVIGITRKQMAEQLDVTENTVLKWENNKSVADWSILRKVFELYQMDEKLQMQYFNELMDRKVNDVEKSMMEVKDNGF